MTLQKSRPFNIEDRMRNLPEDLLDDVGNHIIPSESGLVLPWFPNGLKWHDESGSTEFQGLPYSISEAMATFWNRLTQVSQWEELEEYLKEKGYLHSEHIYRTLGMNSFNNPGQSIQKSVSYLTVENQDFLNLGFYVKQKTYGIITSSAIWDLRLELKWKAKKWLFRVRLENEKTED